MKHITAILEVTAVTALVWSAYKALKLVEPGGFNCSPGLCMLVASSIMVSLRWREFANYGIASPKWRSGVNLGLAFSLLMLLAGAFQLWLLPAALLPPTHQPIFVAFGTAAIRISLYLAALLILSRLWANGSFERVPLAFTLLVSAALLFAAPAFMVSRGAPLSGVAGRAVSLVFFTAFGEELFFRGYVQSRLNATFGRPWRFLNASFGPGLVISCLLFGLIHVFNPTNPYAGHWELSWLWGAGAAFVGGPLYGYLRELTGSIWTATVVHALGGEYLGLWQVYRSNS